MRSIQNEVFSNKEKATNVLSLMSPEALKQLVVDIRAQVSSGLMSQTEAHDKINLITVLIFKKEMKNFSEDCLQE